MPKIVDLPAASAANLTDLLAKVDDPEGDPETQRATLAQVYSLFNPLTNANLVFAGPGTGSPATPTFRSLVLADVPGIDEAKLSLTDLTTADASTAKHGFLPKLPNDSAKFINGVGAWAVPASSSDWTGTIVKSADQTVTNNATPQDDTELQFAVTINKCYLIEMDLLYSGNDATGDYRCRFTFPNLTGGGVGFYNSYNAALGAIQSAASTTGVGQWPSADLIVGASGPTDIILPAYFRFLATVFSAGGTFKFQFANSAAAGGRTSTTRAGSILRYKLLN